MKIYNPKIDKLEEVEKINKTNSEWQKILTPDQYKITRLHGTESAFSSICPVPPKEKGIYGCVCCGTALFNFGTKFESGTGWPSFF